MKRIGKYNLMIVLLSWLSLSSTVVSAPVPNPLPEEITREFIYEKAPFPSCHASTLAETSDGTIVAAWFGGTYEKHPDVGIWFSRRVAGKWTTPVELANGIQYKKSDGSYHRHPCWNPVLHATPSGKLLLFYKCGPTPRTWWGMLMESSDGGKTWTKPHRLPEGIDGPVKNKPVLLSNGDLLCGSSTEYDGWRLHFEITKDDGKTWRRIGPIPSKGKISAIQPSILIHKDGTLQAVGRTRQKKVFTTWSKNQGRTWSPVELLDLPNPSAGTDALTLRDGRHLLVYNHTPNRRSPLNVALSKDGKQWTGARVLENEAGEYSYPAVIQSRDGKIHISYTWKRKKIRYVVLDPKKLASKRIKEGAWPQDVRKWDKVVYKKDKGGDLSLSIFKPQGWKANDRRGAIVFFFGGGWVSGSPEQFYPHCHHLAGKGMVAISAQYRTRNSHGTLPDKCVIDGKSAMRWVRKNAVALGIDSKRIAAGGGSAGGHVATATGLLTQFEPDGEELSISSQPNALVLFNPVYDNGPDGYGYDRVKDFYKEFSPFHNITGKAPPSIVFLGTKDRLVPVKTAEAFRDKMAQVGVKSDLHLYKNESHGFFNYGRRGNIAYRDTVQKMTDFLEKLGYFENRPQEAG